MCAGVQLLPSRIATRALSLNASLCAIAGRDIVDSDDGRVGADVVLALFAARGRDESVVPAWNDKAGQDDEQRDVADAEAENVEGVLA